MGSNVFLIQTCAVVFFGVAYLCDGYNFQQKYWGVWPILELAIDFLLAVVGTCSSFALFARCLRTIEGIPYCSASGGILDSWASPSAAALTTLATGICCV